MCAAAPAQIKVGDDKRIVEAKFKTFGCGSAIASRWVRVPGLATAAVRAG